VLLEPGGLRDGILPRLLGGENPPGLLIDALLLVSQLARSKKEQRDSQRATHRLQHPIGFSV
jgi:hypothetical protein